MRIERKMPLNLIKITLLLGIWLFSEALQAQEIQLETMSISNGLASPNVMDVMQDSYGLIWLGTSNGIQRYDGDVWKNYRNIIGNPNSLQHNGIFDIEEDENQNLWIANELGVTFFDRANNTFKNYNFSETFEIVNGGRTFTVLYDSQGRVWASTLSQGILRYDPENDTWVRAPYAQVDGKEAAHGHVSMFLYEDDEGGIWGGSTIYGLMYLPKGENTFTPIAFTEENDLNTFENTITELYQDKDGMLWITSRQGIYTYNKQKHKLNTIIRYDFNGDITTFLNSITEDSEGNIWILNNLRGVLKFEGNSGQYQEVIIPGNRRINAGGWTNRFTELIIDKSGIFWFGSWAKGLFKYDPVNKPFKYYSHNAEDPNSLSPGGAFGLFASKINPGKVYIGTRGNGINILDESDQSIKKIRFSSGNDMFGGSARSIYEQEDGTLWIGTWGDGLIKMDKNYTELKRYKLNLGDKNSLVNDQVRVIREDRTGKLWIGTNGGLTILDTETESFNPIVNEYGQTYSDDIIAQINKWLEEGEQVASLEKVGENQELTQEFEIKERGTYFLVTVGEGDAASMADYGWLQNGAGETIIGMDKIEDSFWAGGALKNRLQISQVELNKGIYALRYTSDDSHHFDSWNEPKPGLLPLYGIAIFEQEDQMKTDSIEVNVNEQKAEIVIQSPNISDIEIGKKYVWIASIGAGVTRIDPETNVVKYYSSDPTDLTTLSSNEVLDVMEDENGLLWMATRGGINMLDIETEEITTYTDQDGLSTNFLEAVLPGEDGEMWFSSQNGLIQMMRNEALNKVTFINYNKEDGLGGEIFLSLTADKTPEGRFYFGGDHGVTTFATIASNKIPPSVIISNLLISNKSVYDMVDNSPLKTDLLTAKSIQLTHNQNDLSLEFAALHYANPTKNQYAHMMEGLDSDWIYDNRNFASYTNLAPGTYTFKVIASNAYGVWNEEGTSLVITILPPWWRTWWAYSIYAIIFSIIAFIIDRAVRRSIRMRERERSRERELKQAKEIEKAYNELQATQSQLIQSEKMASLGELTAGIAHEIQNPLNFVNNFSEVNEELLTEMKEELDKGNMDDAIALANDAIDNQQKILHHGKRADAIVKGMLQHSRTSTGEKESTDINALADEYLRLAYHGLRAKDKTFNANMKTDFDESIGNIAIIPQDIGRVVLNLITNAFYAVDEKKKSASDNSKDSYEPTVSVRTKKEGDKVLISVKDNGNGIPEQVLDKIFQPFFTTKPTGKGTGLGLSLSYDIIKAHGGKLKVETGRAEEAGTEFSIILPIV